MVSKKIAKKLKYLNRAGWNIYWKNGNKNYKIRKISSDIFC